jgi:ABC-type branched-subunit amino acid transport system substrate-binding protein
LYVYDTWQDPKIVEKLVKKPEFLSLDLIIGPIYPETQKIVSELSAKNRIPMVSALSADEGYVTQNPYFFQVNPSKNLRLTTTADYVAKTYRNDNVVVLNRGNGNAENKLVADKLREKFSYGGILSPNIHFFNIWAEGRDGLENFLKADKPNIIVMYETNEVNISIAMNRLNSLAKKFPITLVGIQEYTRLQAIDIEYLHNVNFRCLSPYFVNYASSQVNSFIEAYRLDFGSEPTQFSFQGYDATTYFLKALDQASKSLPQEAGVVNPGLLQADYDFQKVSDFGGFMNRTFYVIEYSNNYDVRSVAKIEGRIGGSEN